MFTRVYVSTSSDLACVQAAVQNHGCEARELSPGLYEVDVHDPNHDPVDEVTEYLDDCRLINEAEVYKDNPDAGPKAHDLLICGNPLSIVVEGKSGNIKQGLPRETCPSCSQADCYRDCDGSQGADDTNESDEDAVGRLKYNAAVDTLESIVLAHACAGVKVDAPDYVAGLETALDAFGNQL